MGEKKADSTPVVVQTASNVSIPVINVKQSEHLETENQTVGSANNLKPVKGMGEAKIQTEGSKTTSEKSSETTTSSTTSTSPPIKESQSPPPPSPTDNSSRQPEKASSSKQDGAEPVSPKASGEKFSVNNEKEKSRGDSNSAGRANNNESDSYKGGYYSNQKVDSGFIEEGKPTLRRGFDSAKYSVIESEMDSKFPEIGEAFKKGGVQEAKVAFIFTFVCLLIVIGFSIRKYRKLKKAGEQVRNVTNTVFPVKIVSLYLYIFLCFPLSVLVQFFSCLSPLGFGMYNVVQTIYQSTSYIWLWDLFVEYFGGSEQIVTAIRRTGPYYLWKVPPFMVTAGGETYFQPKTLIVSYILVLQYLFVSVIVGIVNAIYPSKAIFLNCIHVISLTIAIYGIMLVYWPSKDALQPYQGGLKFGMLVSQSVLIIVIDSAIRLARYENREYNSIVYKLYWRMMLVCGVSTICTLAATSIIDSREIYKIYNLPLPIKFTEKPEQGSQESKSMLAT